MGANTSIEWTDASWPVLAGCKPVSPGCANCYAERLTATRLKNVPKYKGLAVIGQNGHPHFTGESRLWREHLDWPLKWKQPRKIFVADMSDLFYEGVSNEEIAIVFGVMAACPDHTFQVLTKRAERMREWFEWIARDGDANYAVSQALADSGAIDTSGFEDRLRGTVDFDESRWPLSNVLCGVSIEDQKCADERIPDLMRTPAAGRFLSIEPQLEDVLIFKRGDPHPIQTPIGEILPSGGLSWVIVGGESGPGARPCEIEWIRSIVRQCRRAHVPVFVKQMGAFVVDRNDVGFEADAEVYTETGEPTNQRGWPSSVGIEENINGFREEYQGAPVRIRLKDKKGGDPSEWPHELRVREMPEVRT